MSAMLNAARLSVALLLSLTLVTVAAAEPRIGDDGLYKQPWFVESFLDLREDLADAQAADKRLAIIWEQRGCPYCKDLHTVNLGKPEISEYIKANFAIIQLNLWGDREVTDVDGEVTTEKKLARKWGVVFTPTIHFLPEASELEAGQAGNRQLVAVMPGYFRPFHFARMFEYVKERRYEHDHFQKYLSEKAEEMRQAGIPVEM